jgi:hypothetical protein
MISPPRPDVATGACWRSTSSAPPSSPRAESAPAWDAELERKHRQVLTDYRVFLDRLYEKQREIEHIMDAMALLEKPHEDRRFHHTSGFVNRSSLYIADKWLPWADVHDALLAYGEPRAGSPHRGGHRTWVATPPLRLIRRPR